MADADRNIDSLLDQIGHPVRQQQLGCDLRVACHELAEQRRDVHSPENLRRGNDEATHGFATLALRHLFGFFEVSQNAPAPFQKSQSGIGQADHAGCPVQEAHPQPLLERRDMACDGRGREAQLASRRREAIAVRDRDKRRDGVKTIHSSVPIIATVNGDYRILQFLSK